MKEYLFKYEAPPISEVIKTKKVRAERIDKALQKFSFETTNVTEIFSIELVS